MSTQPGRRPSTQPTHKVEWTIEDDFITGEAVCYSPEGSDCRVTCPEGCETWVRGDHEHELVPYQSCLAVEWWNNTSLLECHSGGPEPLRDGPIEVWWEGEWWAWGLAVKGSSSEVPR